MSHVTGITQQSILNTLKALIERDASPTIPLIDLPWPRQLKTQMYVYYLCFVPHNKIIEVNLVVPYDSHKM